MISTNNLRLVRSLTQILRVIPFSWSPSQEKYLYFAQNLHYSYLHILITVSHFLLSLIQLFLCSKQLCVCQAFEISATFFTLTFMSMILSSHATLVQDPSQVAICHNLVEEFIARIKRDHLRHFKFNTCRLTKVLNRLVPAITYSMTFVGILGIFKCWLLPDLPVYFTSFIPQNGFLSFKLARALISFLFSYFIFSSALLCSFVVCQGVATMPVFVLLLKAEFKPGLDASLYFTQPSFRLPTHLPHLYRQVEILLKAYLNIYALMLLPTEGFLTLAIISYNCTLILYRSYLNSIQLLSILNAMLLAVSILTVVFGMGGKFDVYSRKTLASWKTHCHLKMGRFSRSSKPLQFGYRRFRNIHRGTLPAIARTIAVNTFRFVKMLRK